MPTNMEFKKFKVTAVNMSVRKSIAITIDMKDIAKCKTQDAVNKAIENKILETKVFRQAELSDLKYQGRKDVLEEWKVVRPIVAKEEEAQMAVSPNSPDSRFTPDRITRLADNEVFVFGSNAQGMHYGGAARQAALFFGAVMGQGHGMQGMSYAINSMSGLADLGDDAATFCEYAKLHPEKRFLVTPIGCGIAGLHPSEVAPYFEPCRELSNVTLPASFWDIIGEPEESTSQKSYDLNRFLSAQEIAYETALDEISQGHKRSHWIWYIFPQQKGLGHSYNSHYYGLDGEEEARAYLAHPVLGQRLREMCEALLQHAGKRDIDYIMGSGIDVLKLQTSMNLFNRVSPNDIFEKVLDAFF